MIGVRCTVATERLYFVVTTTALTLCLVISVLRQLTKA